MKTRCAWVNLDNELYIHYHDSDWGVPVHNDTLLFEMLILEGAQAGLSWETILKKRAAYRKAFKGFDPKKVSVLSDSDIEELMQNPGIVRNRLKIMAAIHNAEIFLQIQTEFGSFDSYIWNFVQNSPRTPYYKNISEIPVKDEISDAISKDLKKRGMKFVGSTIMYAYMQAIGMINAHTLDCFRFTEIQNQNG